MGRAIDLFVTYRFIKLLVTLFNKTEAFELGIIDEDGNRQVEPGTNKPTTLRTIDEKNAYTILHKLVFNIKKIFAKVPGLRTKLGTYAAALLKAATALSRYATPNVTLWMPSCCCASSIAFLMLRV